MVNTTEAPTIVARAIASGEVTATEAERALGLLELFSAGVPARTWSRATYHRRRATLARLGLDTLPPHPEHRDR
jgi:hypothetical protein